MSPSLPLFLSSCPKIIPPLVGLFLWGLTLGRLVFESVFPALRGGQGVLLGGTTAVVLSFLWFWWVARQLERLSWRQSVPFWPLWLNGWYLFQPPTSVNVLAGWLVWGGSFYLALYLAHLLYQPTRPWFIRLAWVIAPLALIYGLTLGRTVGAADVFEFQVVVPQLGIVHPTGYPLYLLLGKVWTLLIPVGEMAWRLNVGTAVYALLALAALFWLLGLVWQVVATGHKQTTGHLYLRDTALFVTLFAFALSPTFWSQAIEAEIYSLHNLFVALILGVVVWILLNGHELANHREHKEHKEQRDSFEKNSAFSAPSAVNSWPKRLPFSPFILLAFLLGLGLTNHLTTVILAPAVGLAWLFHLWESRPTGKQIGQQLGKMALAFLAPLTLYVYLPLRWQAVNNEPMGLSRFVGWVTGSQFQDALQLRAWLVDPTRYEVVGRLFLNEWAWWGVLLAGLGFVFLLRRNWRVATILGVTWLGYAFYTLNYYVPDLNVFLLPAHLVTAVFMAAGLFGVGQMGLAGLQPPQQAETGGERTPLIGLLPLLLLIPLGVEGIRAWPLIDQSQNRGLTEWATAVFDLSLDQNALILADSEKIAPLYYLQRAEGMRPDLDIRVLPDEAAYRAALGEAVAEGQTVYLARFLPGLEGLYHLRSVGPLTEVGTEPLTMLPHTAVSPPQPLQFEGIQLLGYELAPTASEADFHTAVTFYWQATQPLTTPHKIYVRWADGVPLDPTGRHPAHDYYPVTAWKNGEIVADYHLLPHPYPRPAQADLQVAFAPPFTPPEGLNWQTVTAVSWPPDLARPSYEQPLRLRFGEEAWVTSVALPAQMRPLSEGETALPVRLSGQNVAALQVWGEPVGDDKLLVWVAHESEPAHCGWSLNPFAPLARQCLLGHITLSGVALPPGATNFGDQIALLSVQPDTTTLTPGGQLGVTLEWQSLSPIAEDYTVFVQLLNPAGALVAQVDAWPLQGTYPTSAWRVGETLRDPYSLFLPADLPPGEYELIIGLYRLADLQRLPVLGENGQPLDDKYGVSGLVVGE